MSYCAKEPHFSAGFLLRNDACGLSFLRVALAGQLTSLAQ